MKTVGLHIFTNKKITNKKIELLKKKELTPSNLVNSKQNFYVIKK